MMEKSCAFTGHRPKSFPWGIKQRRFKLKDIYNYTKNHLLEWVPKLPSYQVFCKRCSALADAFRALAEVWMESSKATSVKNPIYLVDSCPIMLAHWSRARHAKASEDLCVVSYNSTRKEWYYGVKLHTVVTKSACPTAAEKCPSTAICPRSRWRSQPLSSVSRKQRYNTLDFPRKIVCQQGC